jgi:hypothetical protein
MKANEDYLTWDALATILDRLNAAAEMQDSTTIRSIITGLPEIGWRSPELQNNAQPD